MAVTPRVVRRLRGRTSTLDLDTEGGRAFLQRRVAFFNRVAFSISGSFFVVAAFVGPYYGDPSPPLLHAATLVVSLAAWQVCRRRRSLSTRLLELIDAAAVGLVVLGFAAQALFVPPAFAGEVSHSLVLVFTHMVIVRAVVVPSTAVHSAVVSLIASLPAVAAILRLSPPPGADPVVTWNDRLWSGLWTACAIVVAALVSHVIYGLRKEIQQARHLGQYTLEEKLGEGGMGSVYRARHAMLRRPTAIKLVPPEKSSPAALARFEREVQLTASLSHPNTVSVFDYGHTPDGIFYYAMEYLEGTDLDGLVRGDGPQPPARVVHVLRQVASALVEAHGIGLIHRDIKPENIILCERGGMPDVAKVVDFGLVRDLEPASGARLTQANVVQGTPLYLSPEAIRAPDEVDARSDLYGLGAVGYYLVTGTHVFGGATAVEVCSHHLHTRPQSPAERLGGPVPAGLERLILACLEKEPAKRPASAADLRDALEDLDDVGRWGESEARAWWERWRRGRGDRPRDDAARPGRTLDVALDRRVETA
jgi:eukaryotic-like serine/threonine-protein kinase